MIREEEEAFGLIELPEMMFTRQIKDSQMLYI
jgi:hypothetical protein